MQKEKVMIIPSPLDDELLDIVDCNDRVIGQKYRSEIYAKNLSNFRVINAFLVNSKKEVWIPRRSSNKKLFPLCLDASVGGHVAAGESYDQAFARELQEELNIDASQISYHLLAKLTPHEHQVSAYMHLYLIMSDQTPLYNTHDFVNADWYSISQLKKLIQQGEPAKGDLPKLIEITSKKWPFQKRVLTSLQIDTSDISFDRDEANER
jgi:isopentenyldiphosphate isomerase